MKCRLCQSPQESCAAAEAGCPCDPVWEHQCTVSGYGHAIGTWGHGVHGPTARTTKKKGFANGIRAIRDSGGITMVYIGAIDD